MSAQTVLNVDDTPANRYLKSRALRHAGYRVLEAGDGRGALRMATEAHPDLVLLDIKLPDMSGIEVCQRLKEDPRTRDIPVVHISATFFGDEMESYSAAAGAEVYLAEPVGPQELASAVRTVMQMREADQTLAEVAAHSRHEGRTVAAWELPAGAGHGEWTPEFRALLGLPSEAPASLDTWLARVKPEERERVAAAFEAAFTPKTGLALEHSIVHGGSDEERCIAVYATLQEGAVGRPRLAGVAVDITERKRAEAEREAELEKAHAAQEEAERASRMKDEFLAILSHELRTPMGAVLGWLHLLRSGKLPPEDQAGALAIIERNARVQVQLVNDLLDISRIITGKLELEREVVDLDDVVGSAADSVRPTAEARRIRISLRSKGARRAVRGSPSRLSQVFANLLSNAVKFSPEGGRVEVGVETEGEHAVVTVRDWGEGIAADHLTRIFDSFRQAESGSRRRQGGLGLGLAIVQSLVEMHGGQVRAESEGVGKGATFTVRLPLIEAEALTGRARPDPALENLSGTRILAVDDEPDHLDMLARILRSCGADVRTAGSADEALREADAWRPQLLVLDVGMPDQDGYELLGRLRSVLSATPESLPAVAVTGFASAADAARAFASGFQAHLPKPFDPQELARHLGRLAPIRGQSPNSPS